MPEDRRQALLDRVVDHLSADGLTDLSLRAVAAKIGSSHRMLLYHFGSSEGLLEAVVRDVEQRTRHYLTEIAQDDDLSDSQLALALWSRVSAKEQLPLVRLFFSVYVRLLQQGEQTLAAEFTDSWIQPSVAVLVERGMSRAEALRHTRLGLAVTRGLLLDLLATNDRQGTDAAMRTYVDLTFGAEDGARGAFECRIGGDY